MNNQVSALSVQLGALLLNRQYTVSCAESCTGGGIASAITDVAGSSQWFHAGLVTYANEAKKQFLNVSETSLADEGAVSEVVVREMVRGVLDITGADVAVSVSGIAGPEGGSEDKPVGTVYFAWAIRNGVEITACYHFEGTRAQVREAAIERALQGLVDTIKNHSTV